MKVTPTQAEATQSLEARVGAELRGLRKLRGGITVEAISHMNVICQLLGAGDPYVAYTKLQHEVLASNLDISIKAAAASLGFSSSGQSHLDRLNEFAAEAGLEQRQVRRHSDRGIAVLATLISSNWAVETVPQLTAIIEYVAGAGWRIHLRTQRLHVVEMSEPEVTVMVGSTHDEYEMKWIHGDRRSWRYGHTSTPLNVRETSEDVSVVVVWRGELWPKFNVQWLTPCPYMVSETLGNKVMLRLLENRLP
ncbi:hypothetical protein M2390_000299 [Mycetocola sp. BIGb0189]|uniref:hypothetical protein n=1 Tax=Mycetocola sp. BIGb0189 TaxID=2940604 RepID=UPI00216AA811|nr:hypothetical protein [Mycetocola sp. BIGb0189]MCS4275141.1 hypothetical protein [Mycetocola sp. BIGb0189]